MKLEERTGCSEREELNREAEARLCHMINEGRPVGPTADATRIAEALRSPVCPLGRHPS